MSPSAHDVSPLVAVVVVMAAAAALAGCGQQDRGAPRAGKTPAATPSTTPTAAANGAQPGPPRTHDAVVRAVAGRRIDAGDRRIRVDAATVACGGIGAPDAHLGGEPAWRRFRCIQPTFPAGSVAGPDLIFTVASVEPRRLVVERARLTSY